MLLHTRRGGYSSRGRGKAATLLWRCKTSWKTAADHKLSALSFPSVFFKLCGHSEHLPSHTEESDPAEVSRSDPAMLAEQQLLCFCPEKEDREAQTQLLASFSMAKQGLPLPGEMSGADQHHGSCVGPHNREGDWVWGTISTGDHQTSQNMPGCSRQNRLKLSLVLRGFFSFPSNPQKRL